MYYIEGILTLRAESAQTFEGRIAVSYAKKCRPGTLSHGHCLQVS